MVNHKHSESVVHRRKTRPGYDRTGLWYVYIYTNLYNGLIYIGKTNDLISRDNEHLFNADTGEGNEGSFQEAIRQFGWRAFEHRVLWEGQCKETEAGQVEKEFIAEYNSNDPEFGYNLTVGGCGDSSRPFRTSLDAYFADISTLKGNLFSDHLLLVISIAKKYSQIVPAMELEDLIQEGNLGLLNAIQKYDPTKKVKFSTHAYWWIREAVLRCVKYNRTLIRIPTKTQEAISRINKGVSSLELEDITEEEFVMWKFLDEMIPLDTPVARLDEIAIILGDD